MSSAQPGTASPSTAPPRPVVTTELRSQALRLAALARCDDRTALKALLEGPASIRVMRVREDIERALRELDAAEEQGD